MRAPTASQSGMSLVEVVVALTIGSMLMLSAAAVAGAGLPRMHAVGERVRTAMEQVEEQSRLMRQANSDPVLFDWQGQASPMRRLIEP